MINAEVSKTANDTFMVRFSEPNEEFKSNNWIPVESKGELQRRLHTKNRHYILEKLASWLIQRKKGNFSLESRCNTLINALSVYKNASLASICRYITDNRIKFEQVAPLETSSHFKHYEKTIIPILDYCGEDDQ